MESIFSRYKNALVLMLVVLAQVVLLAMQVRRPAPGMPDGRNVRLWRYWVAAVVTPPERLAHDIGLGVRGVWSNYLYLRHLRQQNEDLQAENDRLRLEQASLAEDARSGERLRAMLDFRGRYIDKTLPAQVIGTSGTDQAHVIYIDKGSKDGLRVEMPVITPDGVIGKIKNVFPNTSQVLLISDQTSGAGVMLQTTRIRGVLKGDASGEPQIVNISPDDRIKPGEAVLTSGGDQIYPQGLPVGVVDRVVADPDTSYVNVIVKPDANLAKLEEVLVVTEISGKMPFSEEKDMMQSEVDAYAEKQRAADILSEKLPSLRNADVPEATLASGETEGGTAATADGDPARPMRPPQPLHADRYTPGAAPAANILTPGQAPLGLHRDVSTSTSDSASSRAAKPSGGAASGSGLDAAGGEAALKSRFPPKPKPAAPAAGATVAGYTTTGSAASGLNAGSTGAAARMASSGAANSGLPASTSRGATPAPPKPAARAAGSGFVLPLQPAYPGAERRTVSPVAESAGTASIARPARPAKTVAAEANGAAASTGAGATTVARAPRPAGTASGSGTSGSRRIVIPGDYGGSGILTPAGMGSFGGSPRPRVAAPSGGTNASGAPKLQSPAARTAPSERPSAAPAKPSAASPPGGI